MAIIANEIWEDEMRDGWTCDLPAIIVQKKEKRKGDMFSSAGCNHGGQIKKIVF